MKTIVVKEKAINFADEIVMKHYRKITWSLKKISNEETAFDGVIEIAREMFLPSDDFKTPNQLEAFINTLGITDFMEIQEVIIDLLDEEDKKKAEPKEA